MRERGQTGKVRERKGNSSLSEGLLYRGALQQEVRTERLPVETTERAFGGVGAEKANMGVGG